MCIERNHGAKELNDRTNINCHFQIEAVDQEGKLLNIDSSIHITRQLSNAEHNLPDFDGYCFNLALEEISKTYYERYPDTLSDCTKFKIIITDFEFE